jgi:hypothetical protein
MILKLQRFLEHNDFEGKPTNKVEHSNIFKLSFKLKTWNLKFEI